MADVADVAAAQTNRGTGDNEWVISRFLFYSKEERRANNVLAVYKRGKEQGFWQPHQTIVVAVSGGVDSMAL